jgi:hypothetical protein
MMTVLKFAIAMLAALYLVPVAAAPRSEALELEDKDRALVAKETLKQKRSGGSDKASKDKGCGNVDIGNDENKKGSGRIAERQKTVIVTGNVYNNANCRR